MNIDKPCHNSFCEPAATGRRSKKTHGLSPMHTESLTRIFFDLFFWCKGILNGFASVTACGCLGSDCPLMCSCIDCPVICRYLVYIYCPKESKCRHLQNPSKIPFVLSRYNPCQKKIKKKKSKNESVKRLRCISDNPWAFFDLSSVAAGLQSAMQQYYLPTIYIIRIQP